ncbi:MAG: sulfotransferase [Desulfobulbaceae bacterium]|nr:sulfotransferase [Desulfobulbaceae bacterium]
METAPFFIVGTERSGSNLLRLILNAHSGIAVPHPPHILKYFSPLERSYGDLSQAGTLPALVDDVLSLLDAHIYPWEKEISSTRVIRKILLGERPYSLPGVFFSVYDEYLCQTHKRRWGCKSTFVIQHVEQVLATDPASKFILLVRDPRDVAVSSRHSIFNPFHPYFTAKLWHEQQLEGVKWLESTRRCNFHLVRYEDLIERPQESVMGICRFLGEDFEPAMLEYYRTNSARKSRSLSTSWQNVGGPIQSANRNKFKQGLSAEEIKIVEGVTGDLMDRFAYVREVPAQGSFRSVFVPSALRLRWFSALDWYWFLLMEWRSWRQDRNYRLHWRRRLFLLRLRLRRRFYGKG